WIEGCIEGVTGWAIEDGADDAEEARSLYSKLETAIVPLYRDTPEKWARLMRTTLAFNGSYFNTHRMVIQYTRNAYYPAKPVTCVPVQEETYVD
ncbi:MAG: alpha-glucan family phosphorylase, partial [Acidobacteriota bacterium]|nr:alpha-glucan family phosphorylase [Acidobacteriota bacterium]